MDRIPVRELNQHTSAVLARVSGGESLEITVSGKPTALLVPISVASADLQGLVGRGRLIPATDAGPIALPGGEADLTTDSTQIVSDLREERL
ncbi:type II toxin-antitoxin system Phd/YefM family antitoxin [Kribbella catacumbae]|uniref:type II toxin-antitoxin system Phd/YefM family antitoxin n=1 Tax=Kribbella catacumbae TaxID=460086 RepID=UPI00035FCAC3|nr:type II toxin-antitoxin system prevent-host-death family antitoxin [Kribbella catacumbae]